MPSLSSSLPLLGVGVSYRWELNPLFARLKGEVDWLEVTPEHFLPLTADARARLELLARRYPIAGHSLELSIGSDGADAPGYREGLLQVLAATRSVWHSDHLCFTRVGDRPVRALTPLPFNDAAVETAVRNIRRVQATLQVPFLVENVAYYFSNPTSTMDEAELIRRVVLEADCGLLLDLHNVFTNAVNFRYDPYRFIDRLPLDRVVQIHIAGGETLEGIRLDTHSGASPEEVWALLEYVVPRCAVRGINLEMDSGFLAGPRLVEELGRARAILRRHAA